MSEPKDQSTVPSVDSIVRHLSGFQRALLEDMEPCMWYVVSPFDGYKTFPEWFYRNQSQPLATLSAMVRAGAIIRKCVKHGAWSFPVYLRPCCGRRDEYNGFASGPLVFACPHHCGCHD